MGWGGLQAQGEGLHGCSVKNYSLLALLALAWLSAPLRTSVVAQTVNSLSATWETRVQVLGQEDPLEKGMATHSCILAWRIPWTEEPGGLQFHRVAETDRTEQRTHSLSQLH